MLYKQLLVFEGVLGFAGACTRDDFADPAGRNMSNSSARGASTFQLTFFRFRGT